MAYTESEQAEALLKLALSGYDYQKTSDELGIPIRTLRRWDKNIPKKRIVWYLERALIHLLGNIPERMSGKDWAMAVGILLDKVMLFQGMPTERIERIISTLSETDGIEFDGILEEAERILAGEAEEGGRQADSPPG